MDWIKSHPWLATLVIGGGAVLLYFYWKSGSSTTAVQTAGPDPQLAAMQQQAQTQLALGQLAANAKANDNATALQGQNQQLAAALAAAQLSAGVQNNQTSTAGDIA